MRQQLASDALDWHLIVKETRAAELAEIQNHPPPSEEIVWQPDSDARRRRGGTAVVRWLIALSVEDLCG